MEKTMQEENTAEVIEVDAPENVDVSAADFDANAKDQLALAPETEEVDLEKEDHIDDDDMSSKVKKRIGKLTYQRKEAERREAAAIEYAKNVQTQIQQIQTKQAQFQQQAKQVVGQHEITLNEEYSNRINAEMQVAKQRYKDAYEIGDPDAIVEANKDLSRLAVEQSNLERAAKARARAPKKRVDPRKVAMARKRKRKQAARAQAQIPAKPDAKAEDWAEKNKWFGEDEAMTYTAMGYHQKLVGEGVNPTSDTYYEMINQKMKTTFPDKFDNGNNNVTVDNNRTVQTVASAGRSVGGNKGRKVKLTASQVAIAKRLNVPLEEYAKYV